MDIGVALQENKRMSKPTNWAICGAGQISNDFCICVNSLPKTEHSILAIAAKDQARAKEFASLHSIPKSFGSYEELLQVPNLDIVYIGTIHPFHVETCLLFLNAGINVLCEKPVALSMEGCHKVLDAAKKNNVLFVEGWWSRFFPVYKFMREEVLVKGAIGDVKIIEASFCGPKLTQKRLDKWQLGGGGLTDIGAYGIQAANMFFKGKPSIVKAEVAYTETGEDKSGVILLKYPSGQLACLNYSMETAEGVNHLIIRGTKGNVVIPDKLWCPTQVYINGKKHEFQLPEVKDKEKFNFTNCEGFTYEIQCIRECLLRGDKECSTVPHEDTEVIMSVLTDVLKQVGIKYSSL
ncbi:trans-1,2-dihydrobenzene-1,2-diol dehydrogenase-like isoform X2 [Physella acuta]|uniref:trans-1,2-dihydrobenzene-1,2-diol dehydrogenase-like isoform X2 n=1 Tax=Physella acuta TaxID=109671 RepID=UPI0027DDA3DD|nr:trans-1,2-dihydrobenzene-1,2-diol dehydrogenase-like isoform X2 [Physella acuta]